MGNKGGGGGSDLFLTFCLYVLGSSWSFSLFILRLSDWLDLISESGGASDGGSFIFRFNVELFKFNAALKLALVALNKGLLYVTEDEVWLDFLWDEVFCVKVSFGL